MPAVTAMTHATGLEHRSLFELDDRLVELMAEVEQAVESGEAISSELAKAIDAYLEAHRYKVDRIAGYWRWQQSIADICGREAERMSAWKRAAENRVARLKGYVQAFMVSRGVRKLEGERSDVTLQRNSTASVVIDDPSQLPEHFFERAIRFTKPELREVVAALADGALRRRLAFVLEGDDWGAERRGGPCGARERRGDQPCEAGDGLARQTSVEGPNDLMIEDAPRAANR